MGMGARSGRPYPTPTMSLSTRRSKGFTLLELMVTMTIAAILIAGCASGGTAPAADGDGAYR